MGKQLAAATSSGNQSLSDARRAKQDEFYTQLGDISNEVKHYRVHLRGKTVLCNCDDPYESNFFKYFALNFNVLGLKRLIATTYAGSAIVGGQLPLSDIEGLRPEARDPYSIEINHVPDHDTKGATDISDVNYLLRHDANIVRPLIGDNGYNGGDFRSNACLEFMKVADIVITNPPFSLFREFVGQLVDHHKRFIVVGSKNAITYKEIFSRIRKNELWLGHGFSSGNAYFKVPLESMRQFANGVYDPETGLVKFRNVGWFTNLDYEGRHEKLPLYKKYSSVEYPTYDNYDAIEVGKTAEIPVDYDGAMGVPTTFLDRHNPEQFEILGITDRDNNSGLKSKEYTSADAPNAGDLNRRAVVRVGAGLRSTYARLLIRKIK